MSADKDRAGVRGASRAPVASSEIGTDALLPPQPGNAAKQRQLDKIAAKFQRDMQKLGLGVTMEVPGETPTVVTTWCPACDHVARGKVETCPACGKSIP